MDDEKIDLSALGPGRDPQRYERMVRAVTARGIDAFISEIESRTSLGRIGVADDAARVVLFCASDMSILMTGSTLMVDAGGMDSLTSQLGCDASRT